MFRKIATVIGVTGMACAIAVSAGAGIGPDGFAQYARQGIVNENNTIYGKGHSPWLVNCTDAPNYQKMTDTVTCKVRLRNP